MTSSTATSSTQPAIPVGTPGHATDVATYAGLIDGGAIDRALLPKFESVEQLGELRATLPRGAQVIGGLETARGGRGRPRSAEQVAHARRARGRGGRGRGAGRCDGDAVHVRMARAVLARAGEELA